MSWLFIIILSYLFFGLSSFGDKLILSGPPRPKTYVFFVGLIGIFVLLILPFVGLSSPSLSSLIWVVLEPIAFLSAVYFMFSAVKKFDVSRVVPTIGAIQPVLIFFLAAAFLGAEPIKPPHFLAFLILLIGSIAISANGKFAINKDYLRPVILSALMFSLDFIFLKLLFSNLPFWQGIIWTRLFGVLLAIFLLFSKKFRTEIFGKREFIGKKTGSLFIFTQLCGGVAGFLQSFAIFLAPASYLALMNSLKGLQYVFLFIITLIFSFLFPKILKEEISKRTIIQKSFSIFLIIVGLVFLVLY